MLATVLVLAPWAIHNAVALGRFVPISTGGGKALFIGTDLDAGGDSVKVREELLARRPALRARLSAGGPIDDPSRFVLERVLGRVAAESYPGLETDAALARLGRKNLEHDVTEEPLRFAGMLATKSYEAWTDAARGVMLDAALAGAAARRRPPLAGRGRRSSPGGGASRRWSPASFSST